MEAAPTSIVTAVGIPVPRGGYRGRGGLPMRGGYERGRGRGMGRGGHYMGGGLGRGGGLSGMGGPPQGMMPGRGMGMRPPRGLGYQGRGYIPRGGPPMRGGRPPMYVQPPKQHTGAENNKTVSPLPAAGGTAAVTSESDTATPTTTANNAGTVTASTVANAAPLSVNSNGTSLGGQIAPPQMRGPPRGRGGSFLRGRGSYNPHANGMHGMGGSMGMEHGQMPMRRGGPPRGRGGYGQTMTRAPMHQHSANTQIAPVPTLKRGAPTGPPGPKRGRYEGGPYSQRPMVPKYHQAPQHVSAMAPQSSYGAPPNHHQQQSHHGYASHDQSQAIDPYAQSYAATTAPSYNGYGQSGYATHTAPAQASSTYATHGGEYDQSQYQSYNSAAYGTQQDTRYQTYGQDYTQQYGAPAVDYNSTVQADYSQHGQQGYDDRSYAGYEYQQNYSNAAAGYY